MLVALTAKVMQVQELPDSQTVGNALYGFQRMSGDHSEVIALLSAVTTHCIACPDKLSAQHISNALFGLKGMSCEHPEVVRVLVLLTSKIPASLDKFTAQGVGNAVYGLQVISSTPSCLSPSLNPTISPCQSLHILILFTLTASRLVNCYGPSHPLTITLSPSNLTPYP